MEKSYFSSVFVPILIGIIITVGVVGCSVLGSGCSGMKGHGGHGGHSEHSEHNYVNDTSEDVEIIRKGKINVYEIDVNMDGYVYQDQMHWNVLSDEPAKCPICGMALKKIPNRVAIKNLKENGFEVQE